MQVFHIRGWFSAIVFIVAAVVAALALLVALPSAFLTVLWNAIVFEAAKGPEIDFVQGLLLWSFIAVMVKAIFNPSIKLPIQIVQQGGKPQAADAPKDKKAEEGSEPVATEAAAQLDNQQNQG